MLDFEGVVSLLLLFEFFLVAFVNFFVLFIEEFKGELFLCAVLESPELHPPHLTALLRNFVLLLVF